MLIAAGLGARRSRSRTRRNAADKVTLQLKWVTQAQFAGYYVAAAKGYYKDAGPRRHHQSRRTGHRAGAGDRGGGADVIIDWMPSALAAREKGVPLVNIAQPFKRSGLELTCRNDTGIKKPADFKGKTHRRLVLRQRISVLVLDAEAQHQDRRLGRAASRC